MVGAAVAAALEEPPCGAWLAPDILTRQTSVVARARRSLSSIQASRNGGTEQLRLGEEERKSKRSLDFSFYPVYTTLRPHNRVR